MTEIPLIGGVTKQKLVITFTRESNGEGNIGFDFEPQITEAVSPEQRAAVNVAQYVIAFLGLAKQPQEAINGEEKPN